MAYTDPNATPALKPGSLILNGKYRVEEFLGQGAFAQVYRVHHLELKVDRAVKVISRDTPGVGSTVLDDFRARFQQEARLGARLDHPHITRIYDFEEAEGRLYLLMEYAPGGSLSGWLKQHGALPVQHALRLTLEAAAGLEAMHQLGAVHRDVKPSNILLDSQGHAKLADLGLAQLPGGLSQRSLAGSLAPSHPGTPEYMSPEQESTTGFLTASSDIFSLGCVLFELLTGRLWKQAMAEVDDVRELRPEVPEGVAAVLARMLCQQPGQRKSDAADLAKRFVTMEGVRRALKDALPPAEAPARVPSRPQVQPREPSVAPTTRPAGPDRVQETSIITTKHQGRGAPELISREVAGQTPGGGVPRWLYMGCSGLVLLGVVAGLIFLWVTQLPKRGTAIGQGATLTPAVSLPVSTPTPAPTPSTLPTLTPTLPPMTLKTYSNSAFGFSIQYPGDWQARESDQQVVLAPDMAGLASSVISPSLAGAVSFVIGRQPSGILTESSAVLNQLLAALPIYPSTRDTGMRPIHGVNWVISQVKLSASDPAQDLTAYVAAVVLDGTSYMIAAAAPVGQWENWGPTFRTMIDSLQLSAERLAAASTGPAASRVYVVESGDSFLAIAMRFDVTVENLLAINGLKDPGRLSIGQRLIIPGPDFTPPAAGAVTATAVQATEVPTISPAPKPKAMATIMLSGKIVFPVFDPNRMIDNEAGSYDIWMSDPQGNNRQMVVHNASQPDLNSGGDLLAYRSWAPNERGVAFLTIGGGRGDQLALFVEDALPCWDPDSLTIVFPSRRESDRVARLFRVNQTNKKEQRLGIIADYVSTFPDGRIVYKGCTIEGACGLYVSPRDGGPMTLISDNTSDTAPTVSPDGSRIAFMSYTRDGAGNHEIFVMDSGGGNVSRLTNNSANDGLPAWSPGGNTIAFASDRAGEWAIWAMDADGNNQRQLFPMGGSPDGKVGSEIEISKGWLEERITWGK